MDKKIKRSIFFYAMWIVLLLALYIGMDQYVRYKNLQSFTYDSADEASGQNLSLEITQFWSEDAHGYAYGIQYDGKISNPTDVNFAEWSVEIDFVDGCVIDSYWNGEISFEGSVMTMVPLDYNQIVEAGGSQTFGFVLYAPTLVNVERFSVNFHKQYSVNTLPLFWIWLWGVMLLVIVVITRSIIQWRTRILEKKHEESLRIINQSLLTFANMIDAKDSYTKGHSHRVAIYSREIARRMGFGEEERRTLFYIALLHDIGKIGIDDAVLKKNGKLTPEERAAIEQHVEIGGDILKNFNALPGIADGARYHHEKYDGTGYVKGLKGEEIPVYGRIIGVADAFDAMSSARCYRPALPMDTIIGELKKCSGTQFDPKIVPYMLQMIEDGVAPVVISDDMLIREMNSWE